jgi:hypothetical protein
MRDIMIRVGIAAAALLALSVSSASACDDFDEEQALVAARQAVVAAHASQPPPASDAVFPPAGQSEATNVASIETMHSPPPSTANVRTTVIQ